VHSVTTGLEMATAFAAQFESDPASFGLDVRLLLQAAHSLRATDYVHAQRLRRRISKHFFTALETVDVIATPTTARTAPPVPQDARATGEANFDTFDALTRFVTAANLTGLPAVSIPAGRDSAALPIGLQLISGPWREDLLLRIAMAAVRQVERRAPRINFSLLDRKRALAAI
jgi:aspartyl-tRNA(Asn)/glutamyl-tRNA(Gln) amidotransferase subunit A